MASAIKVCRVCGKEYEACHTLSHNAGVFRWQEVACSPECGSIYLERIRESRNVNTKKKNFKKKETFQPAAEVQPAIKETPLTVVEAPVQTPVIDETVAETKDPANEASVE